MYIILAFICENFCKISVKTSFLLGCEHGVYAAASLAESMTSCDLRNDMQIFSKKDFVWIDSAFSYKFPFEPPVITIVSDECKPLVEINIQQSVHIIL